jgi:hypothetical protein
MNNSAYLLDSNQWSPGYGGDTVPADFLGLDSHAVACGRQQPLERPGRTRREGGGRTSTGKTPGLIATLEKLLEPDTAGDPITGLR